MELLYKLHWVELTMKNHILRIMCSVHIMFCNICLICTTNYYYKLTNSVSMGLYVISTVCSKIRVTLPFEELLATQLIDTAYTKHIKCY